MNNNHLSVTVSITTYNRPQDLRACLSALTKQTFKDFKVIVVNGGDAQPVAATAKEFRLPIEIVQQERKGLVEARNLCWQRANTDIVCIIDDDLLVSENWLNAIINIFNSDPKIGGVTGPTVIGRERSGNRDAIALIEKFTKGNIFWRSVGRFYLGFIMEGRAKEVGKILECGTFSLGSNYPDSLQGKEGLDVDYLEACHMCLRRPLIEKVGGFDYRYTGTGEWSEPDLAFKIRQLGYRLVFSPRAAAEHRISQEGVFKKRTYAFERSVNFIAYYFKNISPRTPRKLIRFYAFLVYMNCYWLFKAVSSKNLNWLTGIPGTVYGLLTKGLLKLQ